MGDEVRKYTSILDRIIDDWRKQAVKDLAKDLTPITKWLKELEKDKQGGRERKEQIEDLREQASKIIKKRMEENSKSLQRQLNNVKRPEEADDTKKGLVDLKKVNDEYLELELSKDLQKVLKGDIKISINPGDKGFIVGKEFRIPGT
jgi:hypothetical protein